MVNQYERKKQKKKSMYDDMEGRISETASKEFRREAYQGHSDYVRNMLIIKKDLAYLQSHIGMMDSWESETIRRITLRVRGESGNAECQSAE